MKYAAFADHIVYLERFAARLGDATKMKVELGRCIKTPSGFRIEAAPADKP
jgi:predicted ABC-class ATPase